MHRLVPSHVHDSPISKMKNLFVHEKDLHDPTPSMPSLEGKVIFVTGGTSQQPTPPTYTLSSLIRRSALHLCPRCLLILDRFTTTSLSFLLLKRKFQRQCSEVRRRFNSLAQCRVCNLTWLEGRSRHFVPCRRDRGQLSFGRQSKIVSW